MQDLNGTVSSLYQASVSIFWSALGPALLLSMLSIYASGEISGSKIEGLFRRILVAILLLVGFHQISSLFLDLESYLIQAFGGDDSLVQMFSKIGDSAAQTKDAASGGWLKIGQMGLSLISTLSFLVLSIVKRFLDVLHVSIWNLIHILGPLALLGCLSPNFTAIPKGIFMGMFELCLWKPFWLILAKILLAIGFYQTPTDPSQWFDTAVMNFAVAGLMATTPALVHGFLSGAIASVGGSAAQTMLSGAGASMARLPMVTMQAAARNTKETASRGIGTMVRSIRNVNKNKSP
jgi:hypothetical protein